MKYLVQIILTIAMFMSLLGFIIWGSLRILARNSNMTTKYRFPSKYELFRNMSITQKVNDIGLSNDIYIKKPIPKVIYRSWCKSDPVGLCGGRKASLDVLESTKNALKGWEQVIYGDDEIDQFMINEFGVDHIITQAYNMINPGYGAARADLFRYLVIYKYGGLYMDMKSCATRPIPDMPDDKDMWTSTWSNSQPHVYIMGPKGEYQNWYIYARQGAPILRDIISKIVSNILYVRNNRNPYHKYMVRGETASKSMVLAVTGPVAMTIAIKNSPYVDTITTDMSINKSLNYDCNKYNGGILSRDHYSHQTTTPLITLLDNETIVPKLVYFYCDGKVPQGVSDYITKYLSEYEVHIYNDSMCEKFLLDHYGIDASKIYRKMIYTKTKVQFWKYCILYLYGGYYLDINTIFSSPLESIFPFQEPETWYMGSCPDNTPYHAIIVTPPFNPFLKNIIAYVYSHHIEDDHEHYITKHYHDSIWPCKIVTEFFPSAQHLSSMSLT